MGIHVYRKDTEKPENGRGCRTHYIFPGLGGVSQTCKHSFTFIHSYKATTHRPTSCK